MESGIADKLTDRTLWENYWKNKSVNRISRFPFRNFIPADLKLIENPKILEIGGFPGLLLASLGKELRNPKLSILDYYVMSEKVREVEAIMNYEPHSIHVIEGDLFHVQPNPEFDLVSSFGLIEHFENPERIVKAHIDFCKPNGNVLITMPNLLGINGLVQRMFDLDNFKIHNIKVMEVEKLKRSLDNFHGWKVQICYFGKPMVWLEPTAPVGSIIRFIVNLLNFFLRKIPFLHGRLWSPYIVIEMSRSK